MGTEAELSTFKSPHDVVVETERLRLRPVYPLTDLYVFHRMRRNPRSMQTTGAETEEDPFKSVSFDRMRTMTSPGSFSFAIELKSNSTDEPDATIGVMGLFRPPGCGYLLDEPYWGRGYATEALSAFVKTYWEYFPEGAPGIRPEDRNIIIAGVYEGNVASEKVLKKAGFREIRKEPVETPSGPSRETVFMIERPNKVLLPDEVSGNVI
ncbi:uncharacterized protein JN550_001487 [Neoarthrinium moseri]|uniref:uncharacterized protein n=1 Tax=Neoarthrinium moseri TaxID=1658444 RepID=UPI001FDD4DE1|nr:uncharacterized protein JN550_001487 [Neoarthrinium moseri]KAI1875991.1 hypothetical protein JN550_001487 [Neoarthrinium moseri]